MAGCLRAMAQRPQRFADRWLPRARRDRMSRGATEKCDEPAASQVFPSVRGPHPTTSFWECPLFITARLAADGPIGFMRRSGPWAEVRFATNRTRGGLRLDMFVSVGRGHHRIFNRRMCAARRYEDADVLRFSFARLPLCERPDIGNFAALVRPGIDRPELVGLAVLDHRRVVRTLSE